MGFSIPLNEWLRGPLKEPLLQAIEHPNLAALEIFDGDKLMDMYRCHQSQSRDFSAELWTLYVFSLFVQKNKVHW
jgi:asparagine synthase (glutamine-hydrolysing)